MQKKSWLIGFQIKKKKIKTHQNFFWSLVSDFSVLGKRNWENWRNFSVHINGLGQRSFFF